MSLAEEIRPQRGAAPSSRRRRCPQCQNYLFLEMVYGEGYWWSCLMCGWNQPVEGQEDLARKQAAL
ncbi:MAG: hypothetical protein ACM3US_11735 [Sphingomonadaceae bacterium]